MIRNVIREYNDILRKYLNVKSYLLEAYVSEKKKPDLRKGTYCDGLHIVYPFICTKPNIQYLMREKFIEVAEEKQLFKKIPLTNTLDQVFDKQVIYCNGWLLYGSRKNSTCQVYKLTHIYQTANNKIFDTFIPDDLSNSKFTKYIINLTSVRRFFSEKDITELNPEMDVEKIQVELDNFKQKVAPKSKDRANILQLLGENGDFIKAVSEEHLVEAKNMVKLFDKKRATDYYTWYQVGKCLHDIDHRLLDDWITFSKLCPSKFVPGDCELLWKKMKPSSYSMSSLHYWARKDNLEKYIALSKEKIDKLIDVGLEVTNTSIANLLMEKYKFIYKCASIKHNIWYEFQGHRWVEIDCAYTLRQKISNEIHEDYCNYQSIIYEKARGQQGFEKEVQEKKAAQVGKVIKSLGNSTFKNGVISECAYIAFDKNFLKKLDENGDLISFDNGIYDLKAGGPETGFKGEFRDGCPDDYISKTVGYNYVPYNPNDQYAAEINDFLAKIQTDCRS